MKIIPLTLPSPLGGEGRVRGILKGEIMDYNDKKIFIYQFIIAPKEAITYLLKKAQNEYFRLSWLVLILCLAFNFLSIGIINLNKNHVFGLLGFKFVLYTLGFLGNVFIFIGIVYFSKILFLNTDLKKSKTKNLNRTGVSVFAVSPSPWEPLFVMPWSEVKT